MYSFQYPATFTPDNEAGGFVVNFRDLPEAITQGESIEDSLEEAADCLEEAIANRIVCKLDLPTPSEPLDSEYMIPVPASTAITAALYLSIKSTKLTKVQLASKLGLDEKEVRRLLDPYHQSKLPRVEEVLERVGKRLIVSLEDVEEEKIHSAVL